MPVLVQIVTSARTMSDCWFISLPVEVELPSVEVSTDPSEAMVVSLAPPASVEVAPSAIVVSPEALLSVELSDAIELSEELSEDMLLSVELSDAIELSVDVSEDMLLSLELSDAIELSEELSVELSDAIELSPDALLSVELSEAIELSDDMPLSIEALSRPAEASVAAPASWSIGSSARNSSQVIIALAVCAAAKAGAADRVIAMALAPLRRTLVIMTKFPHILVE